MFKTNLLKNSRQLILVIFGLTYILSAFIYNSFFLSLTAFFIVIILVQSLPAANKSNRNISLVLLILGSAMLLYFNAGLKHWVSALGSNTGLVALFISLPFLSFPLKYENYQSSLEKFSLKYIKNTVTLANFSALLTFFLASLLNLGAMQVVYNLLYQKKASLDYERILFRSMLRGNLAALFWSPNYVAVAVIIHSLDIPWISIVPLGLSISILILLSNWLLTTITTMKKENDLVSELEKAVLLDLTSQDKKNLWKLVGIFSLLISFVLLLNIFTDLNILVIVPIVAIIYPLGLAIVQGKMAIYQNELKNYYQVGLLDKKDEIIIFAAAGFFGKALEITGIGKLIPTLLHLNTITIPFLAILLIICIIVLLAVLGVHPVITCATFATTVSAQTLGLTVEGYAMVLLASFGLAVMTSPFSGTALVMSGICKYSPWQMGPLLNSRYALGMGIILALFIPFIGGI